MYRSGHGDNSGEPPSGGSVSGQVQSLPPHANLLVRLAIAAATVFLLLVGLNLLQSAYTDWLWFSKLGYGGVFATTLLARLALFVVGLLVSGMFITLSYRAVLRYAWGPTVLPFSLQAIVWLKRAIIGGMVVLGAIVALGFASTLSGRWESVLLFLNSVPFGMADPQFGRDTGFYVFAMPVLHLMQGWLFGLLLVTLVTSAGMYMLVFSARGINPLITPAMRTHLAIMAAGIMLTISAAHFLDRYETLFSTDGTITGTTYADIAARLPALTLLTVIALIAAAIMLFSVRVSSLRQSLRLIVAAFGLWIMVGVLAGILWPALVQRFAVDPSALQREAPYIERNIEWTRYGFGLDRVEVQPYDARNDVLARDIAGNPQTINNVRLWDPLPLRNVYNQVQHLRQYYTFLDVDVDRYVIDGEYRQVLLSPRELYQHGLDGSAQNWVNRTLVYTHGYGVVMSSATGFTASGQPEFLVHDVPPIGVLHVEQPRIYYGESFGRDATLVQPNPVRLGPVTDDMVIVNTTERQFDRPATAAGQPVYVEGHEDTGGVQLSNFLRRALYAWEFRDINILLNRQINSESEVLYRRSVQDRIRTVAPFLMLDRDPYVVLHEGRVFWVQDAYTTTDRVPYSRRQAVQSNGRPVSPQFNYIRNSVKVVLDAHNGTLDFYTIEPHGPDPLITAYRNIFPTLFKPIDEMPEGLRAHIRYPEDIFRVQANAMLDYHMTDPTEFFLREDQWAIANEVVTVVNAQGQEERRERSIAPYYAIMRLPGHEDLEFVQVLPFTPRERPNLTAWMGARSDGDNYGSVVLYEFPSDRAFSGPRQIEARIDNDPIISEQFALWNQSGSNVVRGNLLVIPIGESLLYAEPIYLQSEFLPFPELKRVILATHEHVVMEPTMGSAVRALLARQGDLLPPGGGTGGVPPEELTRRIRELREIINRLQSVGIQVPDLEATVRALEELAGVATE